MTVNEAIDALQAVVSAVFPDGLQRAPDRKENSRRLKEAIEDILQAKQIPLSTKMYEKTQPQMRCKVYVIFSGFI
jgi:hypothetical protein